MQYDVSVTVTITAENTARALDRASSLLGQIEYNDYAEVTHVTVNPHWEQPSLVGAGQDPTSAASRGSSEASTPVDESEE